MHRLASLLALALLPAVASANSPCRYSADRNFDVPAAGLVTLAFEMGSNDVVLEGVDGLANVEVRGRACASDQSWIDSLTVDQQKTGSTLTITPHSGHDLHGNWSGMNYAYVILHVRAPVRASARRLPKDRAHVKRARSGRVRQSSSPSTSRGTVTWPRTLR
jgi:hypothetical protein